MTVPLTEEFDNALGSFPNYTPYTVADQANITTLKHKDIRVMQQGALGATANMLALSTMTMSQLQGMTMDQIAALTSTSRQGENWTVGTVASDATRGNLRILSVTLAAGTTTTQSVVTDVPVDLLTGFVDTDSVSIALPAFPAGFVTQTTSFVDLTSHPTGNFAAGPTASVALSASTVSLIAGDSEFRVPRSTFNQNGINLGAITGVRLRVVATGASTLRVAAIRLLPPAWTQGSVGMDTRYGRLRKGIARNGATPSAGFTWPIMWRTGTPPGVDDPKPIDGEVSVIFNTGSMNNSNSVVLYFREVAEDYLTQLDLDGLTQAELDGNMQPDLGTAMYNSKTQSDIDGLTMTQLDGTTQYALERKPDPTSASWVEFTLSWGAASTQVKIGNTESGNSAFTGAYNFTTPTLTANSNYIMYARLDENECRVTIYTLTNSGAVGTLVYDTTSVIDDGAFRRRAGRFGWFASLGDGDAYIDSIRSRKMSYAEYRSLPFESVTPVIGAELFVSTSPNQELYQSFAPGPFNTATTQVTKDQARATTGESWRVANLGTNSIQGLQSNLFLLEDFDDTEIEFDLWYPKAGNGIQAYLMDASGRTIQLLMPRITPNQWQRVHMTLPPAQAQITGFYRLVLLQLPAEAATWWVDNVTIFARTVTWEGRAVVDDPWKSNDARWVPFKNAHSRESGGVLFARRGNQVQIRAKATKPDAHIDRIQFRPKYASLGLFRRPGVAVSNIPPVANFTFANLGSRNIRFTSTSVPNDQPNWVSNGSFDIDAHDWYTSSLNGGAMVNPATATMTRITTDFVSSPASLQVAYPSSFNGIFYMFLGYTFKAGATYRFQVWQKGLAGGEPLELCIGSAGATADRAFQSVTLTTTWAQYFVQWTPTADRSDVQIAIRNRDASFSKSGLVDNVQVFDVTTVKNIVNNFWNFGDGISQTGDVVTHQYATTGTYSVSLVSMDATGNRAVTSGTVIV